MQGRLDRADRRFLDFGNLLDCHAAGVSQPYSFLHAPRQFANTCFQQCPPFACLQRLHKHGVHFFTVCAGSFVATRLVYGEGITHVEALGKDPSRLAAAATTYVGAQRDVSQLQEKVLASSLDEAVKTDVLKLLRPSLSWIRVVV